MTLVYIARDADGEALYVGHTNDLRLRRNCHAQTAAWFPRAVEWDVVGEYADKAEALEFERNLIFDLEPEFNVQGNPRHLSWDEYLRWIDWDAA